MLIGAVLLVGGIALVIWGAERFTDGAVRVAVRFGLSTFSVGAIASGFEPENLVTGIRSAADGLAQVALGTVIGSAVFMLAGGLGLTLLLVPMAVRLPREGIAAMLVALAAFGVALWNDGAVTRLEGAALVLTATALMIWLVRRSPVFARVLDDDGEPGRPSGAHAVMLLALGIGVMLAGAELLVRGVRMLLGSAGLSETFLGMVVIGLGESVEETARMVTPARRGHPELAWGNVVGTTIVLLGINLGVIALVRPLDADPLVLRFHAPFLAACVVLVAAALARGRALGWKLGVTLVGLYAVYLVVNLAHMWR